MSSYSILFYSILFASFASFELAIFFVLGLSITDELITFGLY